MLIGLIFTLCIVIGMFAGLLMFWKVPSLQPISGQKKPYSMLSVIIPARNEAKRIGPLLESLKKQKGQAFEVIVVDDASTDETARLVHSYGYTVIKNEKLEDGWVGKSAACWLGANKAKGKHLLFLDADTQFNSDFLYQLAKKYEQKKETGIVSVQPYHTVERPYEHLSALFNIIVMVGMNVFTAFGNKLEAAGSFGPCILCNKKEYMEVGGHAAIKDAVMDDIELGEAFMQAGYRVRCYSGKGLLTFRMYPEGLPQLLEGWTKNFATASQSTHPIVLSLVSIWIAGGFLSFFFLAYSIIWAPFLWVVASVITYFLFMLQFFWFARRTGNFRFWVFIFFPLHLLFFTGLFCRSIYMTHVVGSVNWRGRKIKV